MFRTALSRCSAAAYYSTPNITARSHLMRSVSLPCLSMVRHFSAGPPPLTVQQIEDRVLHLLKDFDKVEASKLVLDAHFTNDLGLDSLDQVEITMALEDEFSIELPDRDAEEILTPRLAVEKIFANKSAM
ncbi:hypothetical protein BDV3_004592 [Batrachochytrium dendrobatidis]|nr:mitochondrial acyl carrier protein [Batrachochytrium dendrobatidis]KAK5672640.1 mitochondrial acyl carrier protein [Batrachochytrium dendrobatidis]